MPSEIPGRLEGVPIQLGEGTLFDCEGAYVRFPTSDKQDRVGGDLAHLEVQRRREHARDLQDDRAVARSLEVLELSSPGEYRGARDVEHMTCRLIAKALSQY